MHLVYTYPAAGKYETDRSYTLDELKAELPIELIKEWFYIIGDETWESLDPKVEPEVKVNKSKTKELPIEEE